MALCFSKKVTPSVTISWNFGKWDKDKPHKKYAMHSYSSGSLHFIRMYSSVDVFLQVFVKINKFDGAHSPGLFNFSEKDSAKRHALKTKFSDKKSVLE